MKKNQGTSTSMTINNNGNEDFGFLSGKTRVCKVIGISNHFVKMATVLVVLQLTILFFHPLSQSGVTASLLVKVCDPNEFKAVTSRVCMLYKRNGVELYHDQDEDKLSRIRRSEYEDYDEDQYWMDKLTSDCCTIGCPPHIFAVNC